MKRVIIIAIIIVAAIAIVTTGLVWRNSILNQPIYCGSNVEPDGGLTRRESITIWSPSWNNSFTLNLDCYIVASAPPFVRQSFWSEQDIREIYEILRTQVDAELHEDHIIIRTELEGLQVVMIAAAPVHEFNSYGQRFDITPMQHGDN